MTLKKEISTWVSRQLQRVFQDCPGIDISAMARVHDTTASKIKVRRAGSRCITRQIRASKAERVLESLRTDMIHSNSRKAKLLGTGFSTYSGLTPHSKATMQGTSNQAHRMVRFRVKSGPQKVLSPLKHKRSPANPILQTY